MQCDSCWEEKGLTLCKIQFKKGESVMERQMQLCTACKPSRGETDIDNYFIAGIEELGQL